MNKTYFELKARDICGTLRGFFYTQYVLFENVHPFLFNPFVKEQGKSLYRS